jgi:hypothetical protein
MKKAVIILLFLSFTPFILGQGTIALSNVKGGKIRLNGTLVQAGAATVQISTLDGELVGKTAKILGQGTFSAGTTHLESINPGQRVTLKLAVFYEGYPDVIAYSDPFTVTLGGSGIPPAPAAMFPAHFSGVNFITQENNSTQFKETVVFIDKSNSAAYFRADGLTLLSFDSTK